MNPVIEDKAKDKDVNEASAEPKVNNDNTITTQPETLNTTSTPARKRRRTQREIQSLADLKPLRPKRKRLTHTIEVKIDGISNRVIDFHKLLVQELENLAQRENEGGASAENSNSEENYSESEILESNDGDSGELTCTDAEDLGDDDSDITETSDESSEGEEEQEPEPLDPFLKNLLDKAQSGVYEGYSDDSSHSLGDYDYSDNFVDDSELIKRPDFNTPNNPRKTAKNKNGNQSDASNISEPEDISKWFVHYGPLPNQPESDVIKPAQNPIVQEKTFSVGQANKELKENKQPPQIVVQPSKTLNKLPTKKVTDKNPQNEPKPAPKDLVSKKVTDKSSQNEPKLASKDPTNKSLPSNSNNNSNQGTKLSKSVSQRQDNVNNPPIHQITPEVLQEIEELFSSLKKEVDQKPRENFVTLTIQALLTKLLRIHVLYRIESSGTPPMPFLARLKTILPYQNGHIRSVILKRYLPEQIKIISTERDKYYDILKRRIADFVAQPHTEGNSDSQPRQFPWSHDNRLLIAQLDQIEWDMHELNNKRKDVDKGTGNKATRAEVRRAFYATLSTLFPEGSADTTAFSKAVSHSRNNVSSLIPDENFTNLLLNPVLPNDGKVTKSLENNKPSLKPHDNSSTLNHNKDVGNKVKDSQIKIPSSSKSIDNIAKISNPKPPMTGSSSNYKTTEPINNLGSNLIKSKLQVAQQPTPVDSSKNPNSSKHPNSSYDSNNLVRITRVDVESRINSPVDDKSISFKRSSIKNPNIPRPNMTKQGPDHELSYIYHDSLLNKRSNKESEISISLASRIGQRPQPKRQLDLGYILDNDSTISITHNSRLLDNSKNTDYTPSRNTQSSNSSYLKKPSSDYSPRDSQLGFVSKSTKSQFNDKYASDQSSESGHLRKPLPPIRGIEDRLGLNPLNKPTNMDPPSSSNPRLFVPGSTDSSSPFPRKKLAKRNPSPKPTSQDCEGPIDLVTSSPDVSPKPPIKFIHYKN